MFNRLLVILTVMLILIYGSIGISQLYSNAETKEVVEKPITVEATISEAFDDITEKVVEQVKKETELPLTDEEIDLIALVTMAEAEGEPELGKRLVIDTVLNRVDGAWWPNTVEKVVYQKHQFTSMWNGRVKRCYVKEDIRQLVIEELRNRTNSEVVFFRTGKYSTYGKPLFKVGHHYFSKYR